MIESVDPHSLAKWEALAELDGWGQENERIARLCMFISNAMATFAAKSGASIEEADFKDADYFMPFFDFEKPPDTATKVQTFEQMEAACKRLAKLA